MAQAQISFRKKFSLGPLLGEVIEMINPIGGDTFTSLIQKPKWAFVFPAKNGGIVANCSAELTGNKTFTLGVGDGSTNLVAIVLGF